MKSVNYCYLLLFYFYSLRKNTPVGININKLKKSCSNILLKLQ